MVSVAALLEARADDDRPVHVGVLVDNLPEPAGDSERADCDLVLSQPRYAGQAAALRAGHAGVARDRLQQDPQAPAREGRPADRRPGVVASRTRPLAYRRMTAADAAGLRAEFERRGRLHLLEGSG